MITVYRLCWVAVVVGLLFGCDQTLPQSDSRVIQSGSSFVRDDIPPVDDEQNYLHSAVNDVLSTSDINDVQSTSDINDLQSTSDVNDVQSTSAEDWLVRTQPDAEIDSEIHDLKTDRITMSSYRVLMSDQITLKAIVARPAGDERLPVVVMPSSWAFNYLEYALQARKLASRGYVAVSFTSRGFWDAGGVVGAADRRTVQDVSEIIDWAVATQQGDVTRIAAGGISYGAGLALLAAAKDPRIVAVFCLSGWTDLAESLYYNETVSKQAALLLGGLGHLTGRLSDELLQILEEARKNTISIDSVNLLEISRSPYFALNALNINQPAILQINGWNDALFPPGQLLKFYKQYQGKYRLIITAGDHGTHEFAGLLGLPNESWSETANWLDAHLQANEHPTNRNSVKFYTKNTQKIVNVNNLRNLPVAWEEFQLGGHAQAWPSSSVRNMFHEPTPLVETWRLPILGGLHTGASSGIAIVTGSLQDRFQFAAAVNTDSVARRGAAVWRSQKRDQSSIIIGSPRVKIQLVPWQVNSTIMAYLYDEDQSGKSRLIAHAPYTKRGAVVGQPLQVEINLLATTYELPAGHRLVFAIDTKDSRYSGVTKLGDTMDLISLPGQPAILEVPFSTNPE